MPQCEIRAYLSDAGIDDYQWAQCTNVASHELAYVRPWERSEVLAARTTAGYVRRLHICDECARTLGDMLAGDDETSRWVAVDGDPDPFE